MNQMTTAGVVAGHSGLSKATLDRPPAEWPLSIAQERLWLLDRLERPRGRANNISGVWRLCGALDTAALARCVDAIVERHAVLRASVHEVAGELRQVVDDRRPGQYELAVGAAREEELPAIVSQFAQQRFDLDRGPLWRMTLLTLADDEHALVWSFHHLVFDGWSLGVFVDELEVLYKAFQSGAPNPLPVLPMSYAAFATWQRERARTGALDENVDYWARQLAGLPPLLDLPTSHPRRPLRHFEAGTHCTALRQRELEAIAVFARSQRVTLFMFLLAAFAVLLARYSRQQDIVVGSPSAGRSDRQHRGLIGMFVNMLALRVRVRPHMRFCDLLGEVRKTAVEAYRHQDTPFGLVADRVAGPGTPDTTPIYQVMIALQDTTWRVPQFGGVAVEAVIRDSPQTSHDLELYIQPRGHQLHLQWTYARDLFDAVFVEQVAGDFSRLLLDAIANPSGPVDALGRPDVVQQGTLASWNATERGVPATTLSALFERQVIRTPDATAIMCHGEAVTFAALNRRANQLAHLLIARGVAPEDVVAIALERSPALIVALLAVLKAGAAYCPLDPLNSDERITLILEDARPTGVIATADSAPHAAGGWCLLLDSPETVAALQSSPIANPAETDGAPRLMPAHPAYIVYTSGSTGRPKGVVGLHAGAVNRISWGAHAYPFTPHELVVAKTSIGFIDGSTELLGPLLHGTTTFLADSMSARSPDALADIIERHGIGRITLVPTLLNALLERERARKVAPCRLWIVSGEALLSTSVARFASTLPSARLVNLFGMSEASGDSLAAECGNGPVLIGTPIWNTRIHVLDSQMRPVPIGAVGELFVAGMGLARGYLGRPALTAERFLPDPSDDCGGVFYRTGDLVKWRHDGALEFVGRADRQVKIRGVRVELGEVEAALLQQGEIAQAVATAPADADGQRRLVAHVVPKAGYAVDWRAARHALRLVLPVQMVPSMIVVHDVLPLLSTGKVDREALATSVTPRSIEPHQPRSRTHEQLRQLFCIVLGVPAADDDSDFFELGGDSLKAVTLANRVREAFGVDLDLEMLLEAPTIAELAIVLAAASDTDATERI
jgi:nonribosomal peptide synthetase DhbF